MDINGDDHNIGMKLSHLSMSMLRLTAMQKKYASILYNPEHSLVVCTGPAGSGKTMIACKTALEQLKENQVKHIVITKPLVSVEGEDIGFLPGNIRSKMSPWIESYLDIFKEYYTMKQLEDMMKKDIIKLAPLAYCRGNTYTNSFVICDESQNTTPKQLKMLLTRLGENSKMVIIGDMDQQDSHGLSGLSDFTSRYTGGNDEIAIVKLTESDVCRSALVKYILTLYK
jgi:phosphate starvation-inducible PhoH-like protein